MTVGQLAVVTQGSFKGQIVEIILITRERYTDTIDVRFADGGTLGFFPKFLKQISPLEGLARMVDYESR